jgi:hypothetical protein
MLAIGVGCAKSVSSMAALNIWKCPGEGYQPALNRIDSEFRSIGFNVSSETDGASVGEGTILVMRSYSLSGGQHGTADSNSRIAVVAITDRGASVSIFPVQGVTRAQYAKVESALSIGASLLDEECDFELTLSGL